MRRCAAQTDGDARRGGSPRRDGGALRAGRGSCRGRYGSGGVSRQQDHRQRRALAAEFPQARPGAGLPCPAAGSALVQAARRRTTRLLSCGELSGLHLANSGAAGDLRLSLDRRRRAHDQDRDRTVRYDDDSRDGRSDRDPAGNSDDASRVRRAVFSRSERRLRPDRRVPLHLRRQRPLRHRPSAGRQARDRCVALLRPRLQALCGGQALAELATDGQSATFDLSKFGFAA